MNFWRDTTQCITCTSAISFFMFLSVLKPYLEGMPFSPPLNYSPYKAGSILCFDWVFPTHPSLPKQTHTLLCIQQVHVHIHYITLLNHSYLFRCLSSYPSPTTPYSLHSMHTENKNNDSGVQCPQCLEQSRCSMNVWWLDGLKLNKQRMHLAFSPLA